jgi:hypothetical protein
MWKRRGSWSVPASWVWWQAPPGRGSSVASTASHRVSLRGSVKNSNTVSGVAAMWISRTIGSAWVASTTVLAPLLVFGLVPQRL